MQPFPIRNTSAQPATRLQSLSLNDRIIGISSFVQTLGAIIKSITKSSQPQKEARFQQVRAARLMGVYHPCVVYS